MHRPPREGSESRRRSDIPELHLSLPDPRNENENKGKKGLPAELKLDILSEDSTSLRTLPLSHIPLTNQLLRLTTLTTLEILRRTIDLSALLDFLAANGGSGDVKVTCRNIISHSHDYREVSLSGFRQFERMSLTVNPS